MLWCPEPSNLPPATLLAQPSPHPAPPPGSRPQGTGYLQCGACIGTGVAEGGGRCPQCAGTGKVMCTACFCTGKTLATEHDPRIDPFNIDI